MAAVPANLKAISPYLKTAQEYDKRDPVVAYFCKYYLKNIFYGMVKYVARLTLFLLQLTKAFREKKFSIRILDINLCMQLPITDFTSSQKKRCLMTAYYYLKKKKK